GVGVSVVNALSEWVKLEIRKNGKVYYQEYRRGDPSTEFKQTGVTDRSSGTKVTFKPDPQIFRMTEFSYDTLAQRMRELAYLNKGLSIAIPDERAPAGAKREDFKFAGGVSSFVEDLNASKQVVHEKPIHFSDSKDGIEAEVAIQWNDSYSENIFCFTNN